LDELLVLLLQLLLLLLSPLLLLLHPDGIPGCIPHRSCMLFLGILPPNNSLFRGFCCWVVGYNNMPALVFEH
jgi:drug/metabolite transporter (DMT)-like permease